MTVQLHRPAPSPAPSPVPSPAPVPLASVQGTLALDYETRVRSTRTPDLRVLPGARAELEAFAHRFASAVVEVVGGDRGPSQLLRWTSESVYAELQRRCALLARTTPGDRRVRRLRSQIRSVHVRHGERSRAIAARIELIEGRWCCTVLEFG